MLGRIFNRIHKLEQRLSTSFGKDISTPAKRRQAWLHFHFFDHGILRALWSNMAEIAPGVWRSNQPSPKRMVRYKRMGITTVLNLRGQDDYAHYLFEKEAADALGLNMIDIKVYARKLVDRERFLELLDLFETMERPFVMHCKSGADRAGLASALYLLHIEKVPVKVAKRQLSLRFIHLDFTQTGILDHMLKAYAKDNRERPMPIREWIETRYDPEALTRSFNARLK